MRENVDYVVFDLETTGFSYHSDRIIEIGAVKYRNGVSLSKFHSYVNPKVHIPPKVIQITGITDDMVEDAPEIEEVLPDFLDFFGEAGMIGYNLGFDYRFIRENAERIGVDFSLGGTRVGVDVLELTRKYGSFPDNKLTTVVHELGIDKLIPADQMHSALTDACATKLVYDRYADRALYHEKQYR